MKTLQFRNVTTAIALAVCSAFTLTPGVANASFLSKAVHVVTHPQELPKDVGQAFTHPGDLAKTMILLPVTVPAETDKALASKIPGAGPVVTSAANKAENAANTAVDVASKVAVTTADAVAPTTGGLIGTVADQVFVHGERPDIEKALSTMAQETAEPSIVRHEVELNAELAKAAIQHPRSALTVLDPTGHAEVMGAIQAQEVGIIKSEQGCKDVANVAVGAATVVVDSQAGATAGAAYNAVAGAQASTACEIASKVDTTSVASR